MKKTKILFIVPPNMPLNSVIKSGESDYQTVIQTSPPMGILSIAAYIRQFVNVDIKILDLNILISKSRITNLHKFEEIAIKNLINITENWNPKIIKPHKTPDSCLEM